MNKKTIAAMLGIIVLIAFTAGMYDAPDKIVLKGKKKGDVELTHKKHADAIGNCTECHHNLPDGTENATKTCTTCHTDEHKVKAMKAFHTNCLGCHKKLKKEGNEAAPTKCNGCHAKK